MKMSLKPGLGLGFMDEVASTILGNDLEKEYEDVPVSLRHGKVKWPLDAYLRRNLRKRIGRDETIPQKALERWMEEMQPLRDYAKAVSARGQYENTIRGAVMDVTEGKRIIIRRKAR